MGEEKGILIQTGMVANGMQELETPKNVETMILTLSKLMNSAVLVVAENMSPMKN